ncbi:polysaccharide deacetylase family protein [Glutamicibacter mishrai]|uniref:Polysaccharide deacetylase n=1 Tax=Glutamicibacter mishrai TaxID=1775880 RepID=A0A6H0SLX6_9MICC|nr:polysaccharide deacetylase family protein [Glutamicibacter mishrai]QIV87345.1 polysaccharide deacetylase [Glutamicibacter mishrai]UTT40012.1 polysaccharide deacetylase family protein [Glutamicibacter mishrai]
MSRQLSRWSMLAMALLGATSAASCSATTGAEPQAQSPSQSASEQVDCSVQRCVALTFDDGPDQFTDELLDTLKATETPATFFLIGSKVQKLPGTLQRMAAEGHQIGSHTWDHSDITKLSAQQLKQQLDRTDAAIKKATGQSPSVFRPPLGHHDKAHNQLVPYPLVLWDIHTHDGRLKNSEKIVKVTMDTVQPGSIILMHDPRKTTVQAIPEMVSQLRAKGYTPVTVDQLFAGEMEDSVVYSSAPLDPAQQ